MGTAGRSGIRATAAADAAGVVQPFLNGSRGQLPTVRDHPDRDIEAAVRYAEANGWRVIMSNGTCPGVGFYAQAAGPAMQVIRVVDSSQPRQADYPARRCVSSPWEQAVSHTFTLEVAGIDAKRERFEDALYKAGCNDATIAVIDGGMFLDFDREGPSLQQAVNSARDAVHSAGGEVVRIISAPG